MENNRLFELADELKALRERKDALEAELKQVNMDIDNVDWHLSNLMGETETQNFTRAGTMLPLRRRTTIRTFSISMTWRAMCCIPIRS